MSEKRSNKELDVLVMARSVIRDMAFNWSTNELVRQPAEICAELTKLIGDKFDYETGDPVPEDGVGQITGWDKGLPVIEDGLPEFKLCSHCQQPLEPVDGLCYNQACPQYWDKGTAPFREEFKLCSLCQQRPALEDEDGRCDVCFAPDGSENQG